MINYQHIKEYILRFNYLLILLIAFFLPIWKGILPFLIVAWLITWILEGDLKEKSRELLMNKLSLLLIAFFMLHVLSLLYSKNLNNGLFEIEKKLSFIVFPLVFSKPNRYYSEKYQNIQLGFIAGTFLSVILCLFNAMYHSFQFYNGKLIFNAAVADPELSFMESVVQGGNYFFGKTFSVFHHPSYLSIYLLTAIIILIFINKEDLRWTTINYFRIPLILFFSLTIFLLSSRSGILSLFIILFVVIILFFFQRQQRWISIILFVCLLVLGGLFIKNPRIEILRMILKKPLTEISAETNDSGGLRVLIWESTMEVIKENLILGVGIGDVDDELNKIYQEKHITTAIEKHLNTHNQFLETFIGLGIIGELLLLSLIFVLFWISFKNRDMFYLFFFIIIGLGFLFESILNTIAGVVYFTLFYGLFTFKYKI